MARLAREVWTFEANPALAAELAWRLPRRCRVVPYALSAGAAEAVNLIIPLDPDGTPGTALAHLAGTQRLAPAVRVTAVLTDTRPLDSFRDDIRRAALIKIDVEGHERAVIAGAERLLERDRPALIVEIEHRHDADFARTFDALDGMGYAAFALRDGDLLPAGPQTVRAQTAAGYAARMAGGPPAAYVNNFIFLPREAGDLPARLRPAASG